MAKLSPHAGRQDQIHLEVEPGMQNKELFMYTAFGALVVAYESPGPARRSFSPVAHNHGMLVVGVDDSRLRSFAAQLVDRKGFLMRALSFIPCPAGTHTAGGLSTAHVRSLRGVHAERQWTPCPICSMTTPKFMTPIIEVRVSVFMGDLGQGVTEQPSLWGQQGWTDAPAACAMNQAGLTFRTFAFAD